ncbi:MAG: NAD(P)H-hydrate dehydratase [Flavobacteriaceae bacterium]|nr:NAD(P)H-hydrate dehydratase [Flavobacteriaceae bacterium]
MKIFAKEQIYTGDILTTQRQNISQNELMERAGTQVFNWLHMRMQGAQVPIHVFCGIGNNGGDGLVIARHLITHGYNVITYVVNYSDKRSKDFLSNYDRIKNVTKDWPILLSCAEEFPEIKPEDIIIDAIFGIGLNRSIDGWVKDLFLHFRKSRAYTLAVDMPSGLYADKVPGDENDVVWANHTLSFASPKLVFFLPDTSKYTQQWEVVDIGLDAEFLNMTPTEVELIGKYEVLPMYRPREKFGHKGTYGHALIIGGSYGKMGAVQLASKAALVAGAGLVTAYIPKCGCQIMQTAFPEAMVITDTDEARIANINFDLNVQAIGIGVGIGKEKATVKAFGAFLQTHKGPLVIDADGINILSDNKSFLKTVPQYSVLTPHPKELERLIGSWKDDFDKIAKAKAFVKTYNVVLVIKGANTMILFQDKIFINSTGNPGLSTAGTGDVLTGVITGLMAQGYDSVTAAVFGVYLHGKSADIALNDFGYQSLLASNVIDYLGKAYLDLFKQPEVPQQAQEE